ncbi:DinB family protein [Frankia sp. AgB32]|uniref:DinB family protein n=1 Tax=Frankia sp. AgB32 TaxID=631119 RepID=UPI0020105257|nr:DinB family protein [Frankia sp. AgB32]MCK9896632.1 DinB family protein [Frankia sp. AgB32]
MTTATSTTTETPAPTTDPERAVLLETLATRRAFLLETVEGLDDEQASRRPTVSALNLAGIVKHVALVEERWLSFVLSGPEAFEDDLATRADEFDLLPGETLVGVLAYYEAVARRTERIVTEEVASLDDTHLLPARPWFQPGAYRSARGVLVHLIGETAQHSGHADILRETIDGRRTMG